mmetsp:Transcript_20973/g.53328  ORF Transcript_20973/g.53328 Transcript_20973/m.53328 type:complete len:213 (-) Transcript_20973:144-782(-)
MCEAENLALCIDQTVAISNALSGTERAAKVMAHIRALRYIQWRQWRRRDAPDQVTIEPTARACRAATLKLVHGTKPGPGCFTDGFGLGEGLVAVATEVLVRASPHRTARILPPLGSELGFGAAHHLVQLVQRLEPCSLGAIAGTPARDGGSVLERESGGLVEESAQGSELEERVELGQRRLLLVGVHRVARKSESCGRRSERCGLATEHPRT